MQKMSIKNIELKLKECGKTNDTKALETFVSNLEHEKICQLIAGKIHHSDGPQILNYLYQGMHESNSMEEKRFKVTEKVLQELQSKKLQNTQANAIISRLSLEVKKLSADHLMELCEYCIKCIQQNDNEQTYGWKELLPKLISVLADSENVNHVGVEMTGSEYISEVIGSLLMVKWQTSLVTSIAEMFIEIPLTRDQHMKIVNKLCSNFDNLGPTEIPPLVHQLLRLCKNQHGVALFLKLQSYFLIRLYSRLSDKTDSENADLLIGLDSERETQLAESTVLFYIHQSATLGYASVKDFVKYIKKVAYAPDLVLDPFLITLLLSISTISIYEEQVNDILKIAIHREINEEKRKTESAWLLSTTPENSNIKQIISKIMENSLRERSSVLEGLVHLSFVLLGATAAKGKEAISEKMWELGAFILVRLMKRHTEVTSTVLQKLTDHILMGHATKQYTNCLYHMALSVPLVLNENRSIIIRLLEMLTKLPGPVAEDVVYAMLPIVRSFPSLRDVLIMVLRKALFSREIGTRKMAVTGFLQLLKHLDVKGLAVLHSQSSSQHDSNLSQSSRPTILTQIEMEGGNCLNNNEAISLELLGVLRRCFMQQADVRLRLYKGLHLGVRKNPELITFVQDFLIDHFYQFYISDADTLPPLDFGKAVILKDTSAELQEPLGHLVFVIQQVENKTSLPEDSPSKLKEILNSLTERMIKCSLEDFGLNETVNLLDIIPENQQQQEMVRQILGVYEALMGYIISSWTIETSLNKPQKLNSLFKGYTRVIEFVKNNSKPRKKTDGNADGGQRPKRMEPKKKLAGKNRPAVFRYPEPVIDFHVAYRMLSLVHENSVSWSTTEAINQVKGRREFNRFVNEIILKLIKSSQLEHTNTLQSSSLFKLYLKIGSVIYNNCVAKLQEFSEYDSTSAALALECYNELLALICSHHKDKLGQFLEAVGEEPLSEGISNQLLAQVTKYEELIGGVLSEENETEEDPGVKKIPRLLMQGLTQLALEIHCNETRQKVLIWVKSFLLEKELPNVVLVKGMVSLLFTLEIRCKCSSQLYDDIAMKLCELIGTIDEEDPDKFTSYAVIKAGYENAILYLLCDTVNRMLDQVDWILQRLRGEYSAMIHSVVENLQRRREFLKSREFEVVKYVGHSVQLLNYISNISLEAGPMSDAVLKLLTRQYTTLTMLTKYFILCLPKTTLAFQAAKFEMVVKLAGKYLSSRVCNLITHIGTNQEVKDKAKKNLNPQLMKMKVLKQTRFIPKLVFEMENFEKAVTELGRKSKVNLTTYIKLNTYRDFRIQSKLVKAAIEGETDNNDELSETTTNEIETQENEASTSMVKEPPKKKARKE